MIRFSNTIDIARTPAEVFAYLADLEHTPEWNWAVTGTRKVSPGPVAVGSRFRQTKSLARFPVPYPTACSPQAWATGTPPLLLRAMLGLEARDGQVTLDPSLPDEIGRVSISGLRAFGTRWDVEAKGRSGSVRPAREG